MGKRSEKAPVGVTFSWGYKKPVKQGKSWGVRGTGNWLWGEGKGVRTQTLDKCALGDLWRAGGEATVGILDRRAVPWAAEWERNVGFGMGLVGTGVAR